MEKYSNANKTMSLKLKLLFFILILISQFSLYAKTDSKGNDSTQSSNQKIEQIKEDSFNSFSKWTTFSKDVIYIVFLIVASVIAILTYCRAKDTILQPLKTEIFKRQIDYFVDLNNFLEDYKNFNFGKIIFLNTVFFIYHFEKYSSIILEHDYYKEIIKTRYSSIDIDISQRNISNVDYVKDGVLFYQFPKYDMDGSYVISEISLNKDISEMQTYLFNLVKNPLIPQKIKPKISKVQSDFMDGLLKTLPPILEKSLNDIYKLIKENKDITPDTIDFLVMKINNEFVKKRIDQQEAIDDLKDEIKKYLMIEKLM